MRPEEEAEEEEEEKEEQDEDECPSEDLSVCGWHCLFAHSRVMAWHCSHLKLANSLLWAAW